MKRIEKYITEKFKISKNIKSYNYYPKNRDELKDLIKKLIKEKGNKANLNDIDTSNITNMRELFMYSNFNGDISKWDISNVTDMNNMFFNSDFNKDISSWDVSNVKDMSCMFKYCPRESKAPKWYDKKKWNKY